MTAILNSTAKKIHRLVIALCFWFAPLFLFSQNCIPAGNFGLPHTDLSAPGPKNFENPLVTTTLGNCQLVMQNAQLHITFDVGEDYEFGKEPFSVSISNLNLRFLDQYGSLLFEENKPLTINQNTPEAHWIVSFPNNCFYYFTHHVEFNVTGYSAAPAFTFPKIRLRARFVFGDKFDIAGTSVNLNPLSSPLTDNPVQFQWQPSCACIPNYQFQLLRLFNFDASNGNNEESISTYVDWAKALTIETQSSDPSLALKVAEGRGFYIWRVRPIGTYYPGGIAHPGNWGPWSDAAYWNALETSGGNLTFASISGLPAYAFFYEEPDVDKNWIYSRIFSESEKAPEGKVKISEEITFANGLLQAEQNQKHAFSKNEVLVNETMYDYSGRPALSTLYAPAGRNYLSYLPDFAKNGTYPFNNDHFDQNLNASSPEPVTSGKLHDYYSDNNPDLSIATAQGYPYSRTLYWGDGTSRIRESSGPGENHKLNPNGQTTHTTRHYYASVSDLELIRVFGDEAPDDVSVGKMVTVDPNQTTTVTYTDKSRQTIATCLSANANTDHHDPLPSRQTFSVTDELNEVVSCGDNCLQTSKTYFFVEPTTLGIHYELSPATVEELCASFCKTCDYHIKIIIKRLDNPDDLSFPKVLEDESLPPVNCSALASFNQDYTVSLQPGYYQVVKQLTVSNIDNSTVVMNTNPYGDPYLLAVLDELRTEINNQVTTDALWQTIVTYLENNQSEALYDYLEASHGLLPTDVVFEFETACCKFSLPISRCPACPIQNNDFEAYYNSIYPVDSPLGDQLGTAVLDYLVPFPYETGQFNEMIGNMLADGYDAQLLCDCWVGTVQAWQGFHDAEGQTDLGTVQSPGLLDNFLSCTGRYLKGFKNITGFPSGGGQGWLSHPYFWFQYDASSPHTKCEEAYCERLNQPSPPTNYVCTGDYINWSSVNWTEDEWLTFYYCTLYNDGSISSTTAMTYAASVAAEIEDACNDACESRFLSFVERLRMIYTANGYVVQPTCSLDPDDSNYDPACVALSVLYCEAEKLVELCKEGCQPLTPIINGSDIVGYGTDAELLAIQQSMYYNFELEFASVTTPNCPPDFISTSTLPVSPVTNFEFAQWVATYLNGVLFDFIYNSVDGALFNLTEALNDFAPGLGGACLPAGTTEVLLSVYEGGYFFAEGCQLYYASKEAGRVLVCHDICSEYTPFNCADICLKWILPVTPLPDHVFEYIPCQEQASQYGLTVLQGQYQNCKNLKVEAYRDRYLSTCLDPENIHDLFTVSYELGYYHYTLYYYDRAGNLVQTVPPAGVDEMHTSRLVHAPEHSMRTRYEYNSLKQLIWQYTPDGGETEFIYDKIGQLRFSQNARQRADGNFAYTKYDYLGRTIEVGKSALGSLTWSDIKQNAYVEDPGFPNSTISERLFTVYSAPYPGILAGGQPQRYLQNRVSYTFTDDDGDLGTPADRRATYFSYDPHGNVERVVQDVMPELQQSSPVLRQFVMEYEYDLISNKVLQLRFMPGRADQFFTAYSYDEDNRITEVRTSRDGVVWDRDARYEYYLHGPLRRTALAEDQVQGTDYVYTLQGWLKSINHPTLNPAKDPGLDGFGSSKVAKDAFASGLGYFDGDFKHTGSHFEGEANFTNGFGFVRNLYNGNISTWVSNSAVNTALAPGYKYPGLTGRRFKYDELNRLKDSDFSYFDGAWKTTPEYDSYYSYDPNGNLKTLDRHAYYKTAFLWFKAKHMDCLTYQYQPGTNRLTSVTDGFIFPNLYSEDLDNTSTYDYDPTGNLTEDPNNGISNIEWNLMGKVRRVTKTDNTVIDFAYDAMGNRVLKKVQPSGGQADYTWYALDASGNMLATYSRTYGGMGAYAIQQDEAMLYGSQRVGVWNTAQPAFGLSTSGGGYSEFFNDAPVTDLFLRRVAQKAYELNDHLGNVRLTVSDVKLPGSGGFTADILSGNEYYPFGMLMPGRGFESGGFRFGFQGQEMDDEEKGVGNDVHYSFREYDSRTAKFNSIDPLVGKYPSMTPYQFAGNSPVVFVDDEGARIVIYFKNDKGKKEKVVIEKADDIKALLAHSNNFVRATANDLQKLVDGKYEDIEESINRSETVKIKFKEGNPGQFIEKSMTLLFDPQVEPEDITLSSFQKASKLEDDRRKLISSAGSQKEIKSMASQIESIGLDPATGLGTYQESDETLGHELSHFINFVIDPVGFSNRQGTKDPNFHHAEEAKVTSGPEAKYRLSKGKKPRLHHGGFENRNKKKDLKIGKGGKNE